jgi:hypothetical protein
MKSKVLLFLFVAIFYSSLKVRAQHLLLNNKYSIESSIFLSTTDQLPFWLRSNQYGEVPLESQFSQFGAEMQHEYDSTFNRDQKLNKFSYGYGARAIVNVRKVNQFRLTEGYAKVRYGPFEFYGGRRREIVGLVDTTMTNGSYIWSGNALPLPKIQVSIPNYTPILGDGLLSIKGSFAHGWFGHGLAVKNYWLHQKTFYVRIGKPFWKIKFYGGFNHQVQWGGRPTNPFYDKYTNNLITNYSNDFNTFWKVVSGISLNKNGEQINQSQTIASNEAFNRAGNHLGTIEFATELKIKSAQLMIYHQSIYEDGSLYYLNNISDGLTGISLKLNSIQTKSLKIKRINLEFLNTTFQGGDGYYSDGNIPELRGHDNYFNNTIYLDGWTYKNQTIGSAFLNTYHNIIDHIDEYQILEKANFVANNRVNVYSISMSLLLYKYPLKLQYSKSKNEGTYDIPLNSIEQTNFSIQGETKIKNLYISSKWAYDFGNLYTNSLGTALKIKLRF